MGKVIFSQACVYSWGWGWEGYLISMPLFHHWSHTLSGRVTISIPEYFHWSHVPSLSERSPGQVRIGGQPESGQEKGGGIPQLGQDGLPPSHSYQDWCEVPPAPDRDGVVQLTRSGWSTPQPGQEWGTCWAGQYAEVGTPLAVFPLIQTNKVSHLRQNRGQKMKLGETETKTMRHTVHFMPIFSSCHNFQ